MDLQVLEYLTHQRLLFPALATTYAMHLSTDRLKVCTTTGRKSVPSLVILDARAQRLAQTSMRLLERHERHLQRAYKLGTVMTAAGEGQAAAGHEARARKKQRAKGSCHLAPRRDPAGVPGMCLASEKAGSWSLH